MRLTSIGREWQDRHGIDELVERAKAADDNEPSLHQARGDSPARVALALAVSEAICQGLRLECSWPPHVDFANG